MNFNQNSFNDQIKGIFKHYADIEVSKREAVLKSNKLVFDEKVMNFCYKQFGEKPPNGYALFIGMHGGGGCPKETNDQQYENHKVLYKFSNGVLWFTPRAPEDAWNMWHISYIDKMLEYIIESFVLCKLVNPEKVYLTGYSAGGDGVYKLAPRLADRLAGAIMCAGHPNGASILSLRNVPFSIHVGENDSPYKRNEIAKDYGKKLVLEKSKDPNGYDHFVKIQENCEHWMNKKEYEGFEWLLTKKRRNFPNKLVWHQCNDVPKKSFYWLSLPPSEIKKSTLIEAKIEANTIIIVTKDVKALNIRLCDNLVDLNKPVTVYFNKTLVFQAMIERSLEIVKTTILERFDPFMIYSAEIFVKTPDIV